MPRRRRGYPVASLIGLMQGHAAIWDVFSESVKPGPIVDKASKYALHESIVNHLRPRFNEGVKTVFVAAEKSDLYEGFMAHIRKHHRWLITGWELNAVIFIRLEKPVSDAKELRRLVFTPEFKSKLLKTSEGDLSKVMGALEQRLGSQKGIETVVFSLEEAEDSVYSDTLPEYLLVLEAFQSKHIKRIRRLLQVAQNRGVKTRVIPSGSSHAVRLSQFGGLVCMLRHEPL